MRIEPVIAQVWDRNANHLNKFWGEFFLLYQKSQLSG